MKRFTYTLTLETSVPVDAQNMHEAIVSRLGRSAVPQLNLVTKLDVTPTRGVCGYCGGSRFVESNTSGCPDLACPVCNVADDEPAFLGCSNLAAEETTGGWEQD